MHWRKCEMIGILKTIFLSGIFRAFVTALLNDLKLVGKDNLLYAIDLVKKAEELPPETDKRAWVKEQLAAYLPSVGNRVLNILIENAVSAVKQGVA
jgi:hypothetical protein